MNHKSARYLPLSGHCGAGCYFPILYYLAKRSIFDVYFICLVLCGIFFCSCLGIPNRTVKNK